MDVFKTELGREFDFKESSFLCSSFLEVKIKRRDVTGRNATKQLLVSSNHMQNAVEQGMAAYGPWNHWIRPVGVELQQQGALAAGTFPVPLQGQMPAAARS